MLSIRSVLLLIAYTLALLGVVPVFPFLDRWTQAGFVVAFATGVVGDRKNRQYFSDWLATLVSIGLAVLYLMQVSRAHLVEPVVNMLALLLAVRLLGSKSGRHLLQIFLLAMFSLASSSLLTLSMVFLPLLISMVFLVTVGLVLLTFHACVPDLRLDRDGWGKILKPAVFLPVGSLALMLVFFVILPRTQRPFWEFLNPATPAKPGLSEEVRPGGVSSLATTETIAFRAEMPERDPFELYWRAVVLNGIDGSVWKRHGPLPPDKTLPGPEAVATIFLEPKADRYLPTVDPPSGVGGLRVEVEGDRVYKAQYPIVKRVSYTAKILPRDSIYLSKPEKEGFYLQLPNRIEPRVAQAARDLVAAGGMRRDIITRLEAYFRERQLSYSSTDLPLTDTPVATFLFESRRGYCEYFASSFGLLLRLSGVPARLVGGYLGGHYNEWGGYYLVPESAAHVWVEALLEDGTWYRIDPSRLAQNSATTLQLQQQRPLSRFSLLTDSANHLWNRAVINYDLNAQFELLRETNRTLRQWSWRKLPWAELAVFTSFCGGVLLLVWAVRRRAGRQRRLLARFLQVVEQRYGIDTRGKGLFAIAESTADPLCRKFAEIYGRVLYRDAPFDPSTQRQLQDLIHRLRRGDSPNAESTSAVSAAADAVSQRQDGEAPHRSAPPSSE